MNHCCLNNDKELGVYLSNEKKTKWVTFITFVTMIVEIIYGYSSGSMSLLADGWHMASHTMALFLSLIVYYLYRLPNFKKRFTFGGGKILSLGGYTSALFLILIAISMIVESLFSFQQARKIHFDEALVVAIIGLVVNVICALILHQKEHHSHSHSHSHDDHNHQSAYIHILTDALTSLMAIVALYLGKTLNILWADPLVGLIGGVVVLKWSFGLIKQAGMDLLDAHDLTIDRNSLKKIIEEDGSKILDLHLWKLSPGQVACEMIIRRNSEQKSAYYRDLIQEMFSIQHLVIEVI